MKDLDLKYNINKKIFKYFKILITKLRMWQNNIYYRCTFEAILYYVNSYLYFKFCYNLSVKFKYIITLNICTEWC